MRKNPNEFTIANIRKHLEENGEAWQSPELLLSPVHSSWRWKNGEKEVSFSTIQEHAYLVARDETCRGSESLYASWKPEPDCVLKCWSWLWSNGKIRFP